MRVTWLAMQYYTTAPHVGSSSRQPNHILDTHWLPFGAPLGPNNIVLEVDNQSTTLVVHCGADPEQRLTGRVVRLASRHENEVVLCCVVFHDRLEAGFGRRKSCFGRLRLGGCLWSVGVPIGRLKIRSLQSTTSQIKTS